MVWAKLKKLSKRSSRSFSTGTGRECESISTTKMSFEAERASTGSGQGGARARADSQQCLKEVALSDTGFTDPGVDPCPKAATTKMAMSDTVGNVSPTIICGSASVGKGKIKGKVKNTKIKKDMRVKNPETNLLSVKNGLIIFVSMLLACTIAVTLYSRFCCRQQGPRRRAC